MKRILFPLLRLIVVALIATLLALAGRTLLARKRAALARSPKFELRARPVDTAEAYTGVLEEGHRYLAVVEPFRTTLTYCTIGSPFVGVATAKAVDPGDLAVPGKTLLVVEDRASVKLALDVPQNDLPAFRTGLSVSFTVDGKPRTATVSRLYPSLSRARLVRAEVALEGVDAADLSLGTSVDVSVVFRRQENATLVPVDALAENGRAEMRVFVVRDGVLEARQVTVLGVSCEAAAVSGVAAGKAVHLLLA